MREGLVSMFHDSESALAVLYTLSLHDALPICVLAFHAVQRPASGYSDGFALVGLVLPAAPVHLPGRLKKPACFLLRSEEHTSELQSRPHLVCRLLLE